MLFRARKKEPITWTPLPRKFRSKKPPQKKQKSGLLSLLTIFLFIVVVILIAIIYFSTIYVNIPKKGVVTTTSKIQAIAASDLVASQKLKKVVVEENCYGFSAPFSFRKISRIDICSVFISLESPYGALVVDYRDNGGGQISSDILMRRATPEKYEESPMQGREGYDFMTFKNKENQNYERTAFLPLGNITIGITLKTDSPSNHDEEFKKILTSFYCVDGCKSGKLD